MCMVRRWRRSSSGTFSRDIVVLFFSLECWRGFLHVIVAGDHISLIVWWHPAHDMILCDFVQDLFCQAISWRDHMLARGAQVFFSSPFWCITGVVQLFGNHWSKSWWSSFTGQLWNIILVQSFSVSKWRLKWISCPQWIQDWTVG